MKVVLFETLCSGFVICWSFLHSSLMFSATVFAHSHCPCLFVVIQLTASALAGGQSLSCLFAASSAIVHAFFQYKLCFLQQLLAWSTV